MQLCPEEVFVWQFRVVLGNLNTGIAQLEKLDLFVTTGGAKKAPQGAYILQVLFAVEALKPGKVKESKVWTIKDNYRLGEDIQSKVLAFAFGLSAEIERNLISQRTKEALARKKAEGVVLGRPVGKKTDETKYKLYPKKALICQNSAIQ